MCMGGGSAVAAPPPPVEYTAAEFAAGKPAQDKAKSAADANKRRRKAVAGFDNGGADGGLGSEMGGDATGGLGSDNGSVF